MKLVKAIETLTRLANRLAHISQVDEQAAAKLGGEALKRIQVGRNNPGSYWSDLLPGETKE